MCFRVRLELEDDQADDFQNVLVVTPPSGESAPTGLTPYQA